MSRSVQPGASAPALPSHGGGRPSPCWPWRWASRRCWWAQSAARPSTRCGGSAGRIVILRAVARDRLAPRAARRDALLLAAMAGLLAWAVEPTMRVWQAPPTWAEALAFSPVGGGLALALLLGGNLASALARGRALRLARGHGPLPPALPVHQPVPALLRPPPGRHRPGGRRRALVRLVRRGHLRPHRPAVPVQRARPSSAAAG